MSAATTDTTGMLSPPNVWRQQSEFVSSQQSSQIPAAVRLGFECRYNVAISMDTHVGLNVATRSLRCIPKQMLVCCVVSVLVPM